MKLIDEKGRLFGRINVIDLMVILFLVMLLPAGYYGYRLVTQKSIVPEAEKEYVEVEHDVVFIELKPEILNLISVGDKEIDKQRGAVAEILELGKVSNCKYEFDVGAGKKLIKEEGYLQQVEARLRLKLEKVGPYKNVLFYKNEEVRFCRLFEFSTDKYTVSFRFLEKEKKRDISKLEVRCNFIKLADSVLEKIAVGDTELDESGNVIGKIVSLDTPGPYRYELNMGKGERLVERVSGLMQVKAVLDLQAELKDGQFFYKGKPLQFGAPLEFETDEYSVTAVVTSIKEVTKVVDLYVLLKNLDEKSLKMISVGDRELDDTGNIIAEIIGLGKIENNSYRLNLGGGTFVMGEENDKKQIAAKMRMKCQIREGEVLYFKGEKIENYTPFEFKPKEYTVTGVLTKTFEDPVDVDERWITLQIKFSGVLPEIAKTIREGDIEKDAFGKTMARLSRIISNTSAAVLVLKENDFITLKHPFYKDVEVFMDVLGVEKDGIYYFKNYPVKMGNNFVFSTELYSIAGEIVGMEMK